MIEAHHFFFFSEVPQFGGLKTSPKALILEGEK